MSRVSRGYAFEKEIKDSLQYLKDTEESLRDMFFIKFPDTRGFVIKPEQEGKFLPKAPSDFIAVNHGKVYFLEAKSSRSPSSFSLSYIKDHQWESGESITKAGGQYYFLICSRAKRNHHRIYAVSLNDFEDVEANCYHLKRMSIKWSEMDENTDILKIDRDKGTKLWLGLKGIFL